MSMTINEHHIRVLSQGIQEAKKISSTLGEAEQILKKNAGPRNDIHATQIGNLCAEAMRTLIRANCHAEMLAALLREVRGEK